MKLTATTEENVQYFIDESGTRFRLCVDSDIRYWEYSPYNRWEKIVNPDFIERLESSLPENQNLKKVVKS